ncbi:hypothetical protein M3Y99_00626800 [Aphelenchoides fujianensis]|nr:hypothetical protein M3Y99_00626800 [Aphelenchoides fujianensis]
MSRKGRWVRDSFAFTSTQRDVWLVDALFVDVWQLEEDSMEKNPLYEIANAIDGFFGLAPGPVNLVVQAFEQGALPAPIVGLSPAYTTFGELPAVCADWTHVPAEQNAWVFRAEYVEIFGIRLISPLIHFEFDFVPDYLLPSWIVDRLVSLGVLTKKENSNDEVEYRIDCDQDLELLFSANGQQFRLDLLAYRLPNLNCTTILLPLNTRREYKDEPSIRFGQFFLDHNCVAFDYAKNSIVLANHKK